MEGPKVEEKQDGEGKSQLEIILENQQKLAEKYEEHYEELYNRLEKEMKLRQDLQKQLAEERRAKDRISRKLEDLTNNESNIE